MLHAELTLVPRQVQGPKRLLQEGAEVAAAVSPNPQPCKMTRRLYA